MISHLELFYFGYNCKAKLCTFAQNYDICLVKVK